MTEAQALIHGDLHTGSIMASEQETFVIDPEFAFVGPMGFDLGAIIGNLLMSYFSHEYRQPLLGREPYQYRKWLLETVESLWSEFVNKFENCLNCFAVPVADRNNVQYQILMDIGSSKSHIHLGYCLSNISQ